MKNKIQFKKYQIRKRKVLMKECIEMVNIFSKCDKENILMEK